MEQILKYKLKFENARDLAKIELHKESQILSVQIQHDEMFLWVISDKDKPIQTRVFEIYGTGFFLSNSGPRTHLATLQQDGGNLIWHIFEYLGL